MCSKVKEEIMGCFFSKRRKQAKEAKAGAETGDRNGSLSAEADKQPQYSWDQRAKVTAISSFESGGPGGRAERTGLLPLLCWLCLHNILG